MGDAWKFKQPHQQAITPRGDRIKTPVLIKTLLAEGESGGKPCRQGDRFSAGTAAAFLAAPLSSGVRGTPARTTRAPMPRGPCSLWAVQLSRSIGRSPKRMSV